MVQACLNQGGHPGSHSERIVRAQDARARRSCERAHSGVMTVASTGRRVRPLCDAKGSRAPGNTH